MDFIFSLLEALGFWGIVFAVVWRLCNRWYGDLWNRPVERDDWARWLDGNAGRYRYGKIIERRLDQVAAFLARREIKVRRIDEDDLEARARIEALNRRPWSWGLLDLTLLIAVAYPFLSILAQWALSPETGGRIGSLTVMPPESDWRIRAAIIGGLVLSLSLYTHAATLISRWRLAWSVLATGILLAVALAFAFGVAVAVAFALAVAVAFALAVAVAVAFALGVVLGGAVAVAGALAVALAGALVVAFAVEFAFALALVLGVAVVLALALAFAFAFAAAVVLDLWRRRIEARMARPSIALACWLGVLWLALLIVAIWAEPEIERRARDAATLLLFLGFLPILNAVADWLSGGLTRWLLRVGARRLTWLCALGDIGLGGATFIGLGTAMILTVHLVNHFGGPVLIDLDLLLAPCIQHPTGLTQCRDGSILGDPHDYWWLYLTFLSTLLPTLAHAMIATFACIAMWPARLREWIARGIRSGRGDRGGPACLVLSLGMAASFVAPFALIAHGGYWLFAHYPGLGGALVAAFRGIAGTFGAV